MDGQVRKREPFGDTQLDKQRGDWILAPISTLSWVLVYSTHTAQLRMSEQKNEALSFCSRKTSGTGLQII